jgi:hypothetical protein
MSERMWGSGLTRRAIVGDWGVTEHPDGWWSISGEDEHVSVSVDKGGMVVVSSPVATEYVPLEALAECLRLSGYRVEKEGT